MPQQQHGLPLVCRGSAGSLVARQSYQDGKKDLNFSEFASYRIRRQYKKLEEVNELVKKNEMPLDSYLWIHKNAKLNEPQKLTLANWVNAVRDSIKTHYPADSLRGKK